MSRDLEEKYSAELKAVERRKDLGIQIQHIAEEEKKVCSKIVLDRFVFLRYFLLIFFCKVIRSSCTTATKEKEERIGKGKSPTTWWPRRRESSVDIECFQK